MSEKSYTQSANPERDILLFPGEREKEFRIAKGGMFAFVVTGQAQNVNLDVEVRLGSEWVPFGGTTHRIRRQDLDQIGSTSTYRGAKFLRLPAGRHRITSSSATGSPTVGIGGAGD